MKSETFDLKKTRVTCACLVLSVGDLLVNCFIMCVGAVPVFNILLVLNVEVSVF
jgi:hypothetical protein